MADAKNEAPEAQVTSTESAEGKAAPPEAAAAEAETVAGEAPAFSQGDKVKINGRDDGIVDHVDMRDAREPRVVVINMTSGGKMALPFGMVAKV